MRENILIDGAAWYLSFRDVTFRFETYVLCRGDALNPFRAGLIGEPPSRSRCCVPRARVVGPE